jgi:chromosome segregation protein
MTSGHALRQLDSEMVRVRERCTICERELARLASEHAAQEEIACHKREGIAAAEAKRIELEQLAVAAQEQLGRLREHRNQTALAESERKVSVAALQERHRSAASVLQRIEHLAKEMGERVTSLLAQIEAAAKEKSDREMDNLAIAQKLIDFDAERNACEARAGLLQVESDEVRSRLAEIDGMLKQARQRLEASRDRKAELSTAAVKLQSDAEHLAQTCIHDLGVPRPELMADVTLLRVSGDELAAQEQATQEMRLRLDAMGPVNMMALEEYKETAERQAFEEAFNKINENFQVTFKKLFGGGQGMMRLTDLENSAESGIDVVASPPGKRLQNVLLLSGGEKAMTALALLVGIFQYQPSPFCILDEVDAPLDEANIGRFTELVKEMSVQTQFVLITHSKKTMSIAPVLYGVTMQEPGVSKLVSVRFGATA